MADKISYIKADEYEQTIKKHKFTVVDWYSTECPPCEALAAKYEPLSELYGDHIHFIKIFRQENRELAKTLKITGSPTVVFYKEGQETGPRLTGGIKRADIVEQFHKMLPAETVKEIEAKIPAEKTECDVAVLGGGPAGLTAAIYLTQAKIDTMVIDPALPGGQVSTTHQVSNFPGYVKPVEGFMLAHYMNEQATHNGTKYRSAVDITDVDFENKVIEVDGIEKIYAKKIIVASGASPRALGIPGEKEYKGNGISYCATCDAKYFEGKEVAVIGGGNSAIEEALFITNFALKVRIIHQFDHLQANKQAQEKAFANDKIDFLFEHEPREFRKNSDESMTVVAENLKTKAKEEITVDGVFVFVGMKPNLEGMGDRFKLDSYGYIAVDEDMHTNIKDVFAAGDVRSKKYRQITTAVSDGTIASVCITGELAD